jgi:beta-1,2-xylosyltransferase
MYNDLVLPDEYDRINLDLAPFFALPKGEMKRRMGMVEGMKETFTLVIENGRVEIQVSRYSSHHGRLPSRSSRI